MEAEVTENRNVTAVEVSDTKSLTRAREAYASGDVEMSIREHGKPHHTENHGSEASEYVKSVVFGGLDGIMTTFAIITAAAGNAAPYSTILIFGFSNVIADGFSMGFGEFVSGNAERDHALGERKREAWEVENCKEMEIAEMIELYETKGLSKEDATTIVNVISKDPKIFVDFMMIDELGILCDLDDEHGPMKQGVVMFLSFLLFGSVPLLAYLSGHGQGVDAVFGVACFLTAMALILLGSIKGYLTGVPLLRSASLMLLNGCISGGVSFAVSSIVGSAV